jgi:3-hydroxyisobutyrate dehydrogenase-like beta-hydroxyacid dehydrogenase
MTDLQDTVAMIGIGHMGTPIVRRLSLAGFTVKAFDIDHERLASLTQAGITATSSVAEAVAGAAAVVTSLPDDRALLSVLEGSEGLLERMSAGAVHVSVSTVSPVTARYVAEAHSRVGQLCVVAPVMGRPEFAETGDLMCAAAGSTEAIEAARSVLASFCRRIIEVGADPALGPTLKLGSNFFVATMIELFGELLAFWRKSGLSAELSGEMVRDLLRHPVLDSYLSMIEHEAFDDAGATMSVGLKDIELMLAASSQVQAPLSFVDVIHKKMLTAVANGWASKDWSATFLITLAEAGLESEAHPGHVLRSA